MLLLLLLQMYCCRRRSAVKVQMRRLSEETLLRVHSRRKHGLIDNCSMGGRHARVIL